MTNKKKRDYKDTDYLVGFYDLQEELKEYLEKAENAVEVLELGASEFVEDLKKLAKPYSKIIAPGYVHLVESFAYKVNAKSKDVTVGWGKYYGVLLEHGAVQMGQKQPHLLPTYEKNKDKYQNTMLKALGL